MAGITTRSQTGSSPAKKLSYLERLRQEQAASSPKKVSKVTKKTPTKISQPSGPALGGETPRRPAKKPVPRARALERMGREVAALRQTFDSLNIQNNDAHLPSVLVWKHAGTKYRLPLAKTANGNNSRITEEDNGVRWSKIRLICADTVLMLVPGKLAAIERIVESIEKDDIPIEQEEDDDASRKLMLKPLFNGGGPPFAKPAHNKASGSSTETENKQPRQTGCVLPSAGKGLPLARRPKTDKASRSPINKATLRNHQPVEKLTIRLRRPKLTIQLRRPKLTIRLRRPKPHLLSLPAELRNKIYDYVFQDTTPTDKALNMLQAAKVRPPVAITMACAQLYNETKFLHKEASARMWTSHKWYIPGYRGTKVYETLEKAGETCAKLRTLPARLRIDNVAFRLETPNSHMLKFVHYRTHFNSDVPFVAVQTSYKQQPSAHQMHFFGSSLQQVFRMGTAVEWAKLQKPTPHGVFDRDDVEGMIRAAFW